MIRPALPFLLLCYAAYLPAQQAAFDVKSHYTKRQVRIAMRDGVKLFAIVYAPRDTSQKYPILLTRTPYSVAPYGPDEFPHHLGPSQKFAEDGFIFVYQDVRGRYMSEGTFMDLRPEHDEANGAADIDEATDTYDTIDWLVKNVPNNNGKVGLTGISYPGFYTDCGLIHSHPALVAASPQAPVSDEYMGDDAFHNGAFMLVANFSFFTGFGKQNNPTLPPAEKPFDYGTKDGYKFYLRMGNLDNADKLYLHYQNPYWTDTMEHTTYDQFWQTRSVLPHLKSVTPAVLVVGGWFDAEDLSGTLKTFRAIDQQSPQTSDKLVMGPWAHGGWQRESGEKLGDIAFGAKTAVFFQDEMELPFFRHYLKDAPDPALPKAYVFETGKNVWRKLEQWPPAEAKPARLYFHANGELSFNAPADTKSYDEYISDPNKPVSFYGKPTLDMARDYMDADQRFAGNRPDVLTYETEPLAEDVTIAGPISPALFVSTTGTDSDFDVKVIDMYPEDAPGVLAGYEQLVRGEPFRGKFRKSFEHPEGFSPGAVQQIHFTMPDVYHCFQKGHRIMIQVQSSWFPLTDRNPQTFTNIPSAKPEDFVKATERVYRSAGAASFIEVNVLR
ncbi:MAG: CocE/NonD family hydrolase [Acidobacteriaceae bacterium]|nr:CocE/NonD family hydrolase [Acidobacteriaceae bacterium]